MRPSILIADDYRPYAENLGSMLSPFYEVVDIAANGRELVDLAIRHEPELIVTDFSMPVLNGVEAIEELRRRGLRSIFVIMTMHEEIGLAVLAFRAGASAFLGKSGLDKELIEALQIVRRGGHFLSPQFPYNLELILAQAARPSKSEKRP